jgi:hypothetical protein
MINPSSRFIPSQAGALQSTAAGPPQSRQFNTLGKRLRDYEAHNLASRVCSQRNKAIGFVVVAAATAAVCLSSRLISLPLAVLSGLLAADAMCASVRFQTTTRSGLDLHDRHSQWAPSRVSSKGRGLCRRFSGGQPIWARMESAPPETLWSLACSAGDEFVALLLCACRPMLCFLAMLLSVDSPETCSKTQFTATVG